MEYVDICLLRDEADEPMLAIAPSWKIEQGDLVIAEAQNGDRARATVEAVHTVEKDGPDYKFIGSCFGEAPDRNRIIQKYYIESIDWD